MPRNESGAVTAETAVVLPMLAIFTIGLTWLVSLGVVHVRAIDAARETARVVARGESRANGVSLGRRVAPDGSRIAIDAGEKTVLVTVTARVVGPGGFFRFLPIYTVRAKAIAATEPSP